MTFISTAPQTVRAGTRIATMNNMANRENAMRPFDEKNWMTGVLVAEEAIR